MSDDGGWDPAEDLKRLAENPVETIASAAVNMATFGLVGFEDGKLKSGVTTRAVSEGIGEVSGRNVARKQAMNAEDAVKAAKADAENRRQFDLQRQEAQERQLSGMAATQSRASQGGSTTGTSSVEQQMAVDFLGL